MAAMTEEKIRGFLREEIAAMMPGLKTAIADAARDFAKDMVAISTTAVASAATDMVAKVMTSELINTIRDDVMCALMTEYEMEKGVRGQPCAVTGPASSRDPRATKPLTRSASSSEESSPSPRVDRGSRDRRSFEPPAPLSAAAWESILTSGAVCSQMLPDSPDSCDDLPTLSADSLLGTDEPEEIPGEVSGGASADWRNTLAGLSFDEL